jgi:hypothetical protein
VVFPGGIAEIFEVRADVECAQLVNRKVPPILCSFNISNTVSIFPPTTLLLECQGFVKLALVNGSPLVPCYTFGNTSVRSVHQDRGHKLIFARTRTVLYWLDQWSVEDPVLAPSSQSHLVLGAVLSAHPIQVRHKLYAMHF